MSPIVSFIVALVIVLLLAKLLFKTTKAIVGFLVNAVIGYIILYVLNWFGLGITLNWVTAAIVGFFGIPGIIIVLLLQFVFHLI